MLTLQFKYLRRNQNQSDLQSEFAKANPKNSEKKGEGRSLIRHCRVKPLKRQISVESHGGGGSLSKLEIVDSDVVNVTRLIVLFSLTYIFTFKKNFNCIYL